MNTVEKFQDDILSRSFFTWVENEGLDADDLMVDWSYLLENLTEFDEYGVQVFNWAWHSDSASGDLYMNRVYRESISR